jgi:1-aminocyclopropane-1-carboxylate deaminase/D-cysteine desulfhydrase-like pyridoxal-dependent ACC family enzyme
MPSQRKTELSSVETVQELLVNTFAADLLTVSCTFFCCCCYRCCCFCCCCCLQEVAMATGVLLDPVYSGKALHALLTHRCICCCCCQCTMHCSKSAMAEGVLLDPVYSGKALPLFRAYSAAAAAAAAVSLYTIW